MPSGERPMSGPVIDNPERVAEELREFSKTAMLLSSDGPRMVDEYPHQWVALQAGEVQANTDDFESLLEAIDSLGIPRAETIVRYIDPDPPTLIL